jgi:hypothetical protein
MIWLVSLLALGILASPGWAVVGNAPNAGGTGKIAPAPTVKAAPAVKVAPRIRSLGPPDCSATLVAGQNNPVGQVEIRKTYVGTQCYMSVRFVVDPGWAITSAQLQVADCPEDIPQKNGNPIPGKFTWKKSFKDPLRTVIDFNYPDYLIPCKPIIAAHADVVKTVQASDLLECAGDDKATISLQCPSVGSTSYFPEVHLWDAGCLDGYYPGWCVDSDHSISCGGPPPTHCVKIISSYAPLEILAGVIEKPQNLDLVNWILNQNFVGNPSPISCGGSNYTSGDVQRAIWALIEDTPGWGEGPWSQCRVDAILALAYANGQGFIPCGPDAKLAVILLPVYCGTDNWNGKQIIIIPVPVEWPCGSETAWGAMNCGTASAPDYQCPFPGKNWAVFFTCPNTCGDCPSCSGLLGK